MLAVPIGAVFELAAIGLIVAAIGYGAVILCRTAKIKRARNTSQPHYMTWLLIYSLAAWISFALFILEIWMAGARLSSL